MIDSKNLAHTLLKITQSNNSEKATAAFFDYLKEKNLLALLPQIKKHLLRLIESSSQEKTLVISTKHELSLAEQDEIKSLVSASDDVRVELKKDDSVVGGFSATYDGNIYDGSLRNQVTQLRTRLTR